MFISRKRFEKEVSRRARRICREKDMADALKLSARAIRQLEKRIQRLEKQNQDQKKGKIKDFYISPEQETIALKCSTTLEETHSQNDKS